ncbi:TetR/AcrR family transcriptional regulator [Methylobacillus arboreus]|uniref:TetR/AcrR family transcriptional regulator n=1 Tax=Methylobacillus arboreus TaxID=755170 RepID=UPI001E44E986|nr:TetR/AcrR family transcriptional regulator [Methylobacillus arboreus]MCB5191126.1 TetR/AcrR family transcriptional regulator [Methylobacillus arboreus]
MTIPAKERLLNAASKLFYQNGVHATSVEDILDEALVARQSLYLHFQSKDGLVAEFLKLRDQRWRESLHAFVKAHAGNPRQAILALFDFLQTWFSEPGFHGCAFINIAAEFSDPNHHFRLLAGEHKQHVLRYIKQLCHAAQLANPETQACRIALLMEGAIATELVTPDSDAAAQARQLAAMLLDTITLP